MIVCAECKIDARKAYLFTMGRELGFRRRYLCAKCGGVPDTSEVAQLAKEFDYLHQHGKWRRTEEDIADEKRREARERFERFKRAGRKHYETKDDVVRERKALGRFLWHFRELKGIDLTPEKFPKEKRVDYRLWDAEGHIAGYAEVKARIKPPEGHYATWFISEGKIRAGFALSLKRQVPLFLVFSWDGEVSYASVRESDIVKIERGGNYQRNDGRGDIESMVHFPREMFTEIGPADILPEKILVDRPLPKA